MAKYIYIMPLKSVETDLKVICVLAKYVFASYLCERNCHLQV